jgi:putative transposase
MATVIQAYRFALDPTPKQQRALASHCGATRFAFNGGLALVKDRMDARQAGDEWMFHGHCHGCVESGI